MDVYVGDATHSSCYRLRCRLVTLFSRCMSHICPWVCDASVSSEAGCGGWSPHTHPRIILWINTHESGPLFTLISHASRAWHSGPTCGVMCLLVRFKHWIQLFRMKVHRCILCLQCGGGCPSHAINLLVLLFNGRGCSFWVVCCGRCIICANCDCLCPTAACSLTGSCWFSWLFVVGLLSLSSTTSITPT